MLIQQPLQPRAIRSVNGADHKFGTWVHELLLTVREGRVQPSFGGDAARHERVARASNPSGSWYLAEVTGEAVRKFEQGMGCFLWASCLGIPLSAAVFMVALGFAYDRMALMFMGALFMLLGVISGPGIIAIMVRSKKSPEIVALVTRLHQRFGGSLSMPGMLNPVAQPSIIATYRGLPLRLAFLVLRSSTLSYAVMMTVQEPHARSDVRLIGGRWRSEVRVGARAPFRLSMVSRTALAGFGAGLGSLQEVRSGNPSLDLRFAVYSDRPDLALRHLSRPDVWSACEALLTLNRPYISQLSFDAELAFWGSSLTTGMNDETIAWVVETLVQTAWKLSQ